MIEESIYRYAAELAQTEAGRNALEALHLLYSGPSLDRNAETIIERLMEAERVGWAGTVRDAIREYAGKEVA